ncbi:hypothetical protein BE221DRAFT_113763 [Ostreococcus tauri]|uniref:Uncharacterized protein n=1 Tax=Ostreococcus tauri TaxID=70448 RepID=A0A1Y5IHF4_OSTTA|nr:hypothetical protein BE221DRAFT_113763 [Ostreococcus tauri]
MPRPARGATARAVRVVFLATVVALARGTSATRARGTWATETYTLVPGARASDRRVRFGASHAYDVRDLDPRTSYEVKVDGRGGAGGAGGGVRGGRWSRFGAASGGRRTELRRALLSVEKTILSAKTLGNGVTRARVTVRAEREGVYWRGEAAAPSELTYDIEVRRLFASGRFGEIPAEAVPMICLCVVLIGIAFAASDSVSRKFVWNAYDRLAEERARATSEAHARGETNLQRTWTETLPVPSDTLEAS